ILIFYFLIYFLFYFQAVDGIRDRNVTGVQTCALPIWDIIIFVRQHGGLAQLGEHLLDKQGVGGSSPPFSIFYFKIEYICGSSSVVEHHLAKVGVAGSNPVFRFLYSMGL